MNSSGELEKQYKTLQLAIYCDVIPLILKEHNNLSLSKLMIFSYLIKKDNYYFKSIYDAKTKKNVHSCREIWKDYLTVSSLYFEHLIYLVKIKL